METPSFNIERIRSDFPILKRRIGDQPLIYLDNAATTQLPHPVLRTIQEVYGHYNANIHRSPHAIGQEASDLYGQSHENVARFIGAADGREIIFVRNTTEAINLVAYAMLLGESEGMRLRHGDEIVTTIMEHHSNLVPWQMVRDRKGVTLKIVDIHDDGSLDLEQLKASITERTRLVCCTHVSNVLGTINPVQEIARLAHRSGALVLVDGAQSVPHMSVDVKRMDCDFLAFSGHKMLSPMGIGVLYGRRALLQEMSPFLYGGDMIADVCLEGATWNELPWKFEAGTANVCGGIALGGAVDRHAGKRLEGAVDYLGKLGMAQVHAHEMALTNHALKGLQSIGDIRVFGPQGATGRGGILAFTVGRSDAHVIAQMLNDAGIAVRAGEHCAYPLTTRLGAAATIRASFYIYNTQGEVDRFLDVLQDIILHRLV